MITAILMQVIAADSGSAHAREQLLNATPATEQRLMLAGISTAVLTEGTARRLSCCMARRVSSWPG